MKRRRILVAGLTPAWQQIVVVEGLRVGEVNRATEVHWCASGKVINVAFALHHLGVDLLAISVVGGANGEQLCEYLKKFGDMPAGLIQVEAATRVCTTIIERRSGVVTELVENAPPLAQDELDETHSLFQRHAAESALAVLTGSLPAGTPTDWYATLLRNCSCPAILDARGPELIAALAARPLLVKPNREELGHTVGRSLDDDASVWSAAQELQAAGAGWVLVTDGRNAALLLGPRGRWRIAPPTAPTINPIGCGDCLAAGLAAKLVQSSADVSQATEQEVVEAVRFGFGAAACNATQLLPAQLDRAEVVRMARQVLVERAD